MPATLITHSHIVLGKTIAREAEDMITIDGEFIYLINPDLNAFDFVIEGEFEGMPGVAYITKSKKGNSLSPEFRNNCARGTFIKGKRLTKYGYGFVLLRDFGKQYAVHTNITKNQIPQPSIDFDVVLHDASKLPSYIAHAKRRYGDYAHRGLVPSDLTFFFRELADATMFKMMYPTF